MKANVLLLLLKDFLCSIQKGYSLRTAPYSLLDIVYLYFIFVLPGKVLGILSNNSFKVGWTKALRIR